MTSVCAARSITSTRSPAARGWSCGTNATIGNPVDDGDLEIAGADFRGVGGEVDEAGVGPRGGDRCVT